MKSLQYEKFARFSIPRMLFFVVIGIVLLVAPTFAANGAFYAVSGYLILAGAFGAADFIRNGKNNSFDYASLVISAILIFIGINSFVFSRNLAGLSPLYLCALLFIEAVFFFVIASWAPEGQPRSLLTLLAVIVFIGSLAGIVFTVGFGVDGVSGLARVLAFTSILSGIYAFVVCLFHQKKPLLHKSEEMI